ncbi:MAG: A/G-specific adenine glycosylase [Mariprofundaceae bacterium]
MSSERSKLLSVWYHSQARDLPWRHTTDPYAIWISEVMLQQTQVQTVLPRYRQWLQHFPDIDTLATATLDTVLKAWEGLGYYRRARFIHQSAQKIHAESSDIFPTQFDEVMALPGIGRSTAGAIVSFAYAERKAVLDGNVKRVLGRWFADFSAKDKQLWQWAEALIQRVEDPAIWNQAMMELGATICKPRLPRCGDCPVQNHCLSAFEDEMQTAPAKVVAVRDLHWQVHLHTDPQKGLWLVQRPANGIWAGLWTPPITELVEQPRVSPCHIHLLTHRRLHLYVVKPVETLPTHGRWVADISQLALPTGIHHLLDRKACTEGEKET